MSVDLSTGFPVEWEEQAAFFIFIANATAGVRENNADANWFAGIKQLRAGSWKQPWGGPANWG